VHVDHRLRNEAEQDAGRAAAICRSLGVDVIVRRASDHPATLFPGVGIEEAARRVRFEAFRDVTGDVGANAVLLGHHARDQAETVLLHLMRGSGLHGLSGMAADTVLDVPWWSGGDRSSVRVLRPFLKENPGELRRVADRSGLPIVEDRSNDNPAFRRNRVRHELLPLMEDIAPGATGQLVSLAEIVREDESVLDDVANRLLERAVTDGALDWETFWGAPFGLQRRVVRNWVFLLRGSGDLSLDRVDAVIALAERGQGGKSVEIVEGWSVEYRRRSLRLIAPPVR
ncbi:MAG: tRNA lysidine(34) synthetase TilS, partial [Chloroflexota bacterium]|nr:tRNA lysidine(34) synthetase TilS [Chloroflexota bacterium]